MNNDYNIVSEIYDIYNTADYDLNFYLNRYKGFKGKSLELMAGTGRLAIPLLKSGIELDCVDISEGLLKKLSGKLEEENLRSKVICSDIRKLDLKDKYDLIIIAFNSFSEIIDNNDQKLIFSSIYKTLSNKGEFVFTLYNPQFRRKSISNNISFINEYVYNDQKLLFYVSSNEDKNSIVDVKQYYEFYDIAGMLLRKQVFNLKFKLITKEEIEQLIRETGFIIKEFYGNFDLTKYNEQISPFMIYILKK